MQVFIVLLVGELTHVGAAEGLQNGLEGNTDNYNADGICIDRRISSKKKKLRPGEAISMFAHDLKKLLDIAIPGMNKEARDPLLLHQFVAGLPEPIMKQVRASGEVKTLEAAITRSQLLMTIDSQLVSAVKEVSKEHSELQELTAKVALLTE